MTEEGRDHEREKPVVPGSSKEFEIEERPGRISRRKFLKKSARAMGVLMADRLIANEIWASGPTKLTPLLYSGTHPESGWAVVPGLGIANGKEMAQQMYPGSEELWSYYSYDTQNGVRMRDVTNVLEQYHDKYHFNRLNIDGHSMGGPLGLQAAKETGIPVELMLLKSSPFDVSDGKPEFLSYLLAYTPYAGGIIGATVRTSVQEAFQEAQRLTGSRKAALKTRNGFFEDLLKVSPMLQMSMIHVLRHINLERDWEQFTGIIKPDQTKVLYLGSRDDSVVNAPQAHRKYEKFFGHFGIQVPYVEIPGAQHDDIKLAGRAAKNWLHDLK